jgi:hypothetical protein
MTKIMFIAGTLNKDYLDKLDKLLGLGWQRRRCHVVVATTVRAWGTAARAATALKDGVRDPRRHIVYNRPVLFDLMITFLVVRSFTDKSNRSNSIEH